MNAPVEVTTKYATSVESLTDAWAFVMEHLDKVGGRPRILISPYTQIEVDEYLERFEVTVSGMVEQ